MLVCPVCGGRNLARAVHITPKGEERENVVCLDCGRRSLIGFVRHLVIASGNFAIKIKKERVAVNGHRLVFENGIAIDKVEDRYIANILGEPLLLTFGTRLRPKNPPYPLSLLK